MKEYPTEYDLARIEQWKFTSPESVREFLQFVESTWHWPDFGYVKSKSGNRLTLHTGGWSGNESIIDAIGKNCIFWSLSWVMTRRGGHYYFDLSPWWRPGFWNPPKAKQLP